MRPVYVYTQYNSLPAFYLVVTYRQSSIVYRLSSIAYHPLPIVCRFQFVVCLLYYTIVSILYCRQMTFFKAL